MSSSIQGMLHWWLRGKTLSRTDFEHTVTQHKAMLQNAHTTAIQNLPVMPPVNNDEGEE